MAQELNPANGPGRAQNSRKNDRKKELQQPANGRHGSEPLSQYQVLRVPRQSSGVGYQGVQDQGERVPYQ